MNYALRSIQFHLKYLFAILCLLASGSIQAQQDTCVGIQRGKVMFPKQSIRFATIALIPLHNLAMQMKSNPECRVVIEGHGNGSLREQQLSWDRVNACINYLVDKERIPRERFVFMYGTSMGDKNSVLIRCATQYEEGPSNTPPPFPNLRKR